MLMGLSINIHITAPASIGIREIDAIIKRWHACACAFAGEGRVARVFDASGEPDDLERFATHWLSVPHPDFPDTVTSVAVLPIEGRMFLVRVGEGCEPLTLGLCRYPESVHTPASKDECEPMPTGVGEGWHFSSSCKTQYAGTRGWEHFRSCHTAAIELTAAAEAFGLTVHIDDEGGWWPSRNDAALRETLQHYNKLIAGLAGALKDELDDNAEPHRAPLQAAIFEHPDFEHLEAEGRSGGDDEKIREALRKIKDELK